MKRNEDLQIIYSAIPRCGEDAIDWKRLGQTALGAVFAEMAATMQNPEYHGEGDVLTHTKMVCEELTKQPPYISASEEDKTVLFLAALLHDIGKIRCTKTEDGKLTSPNHSRVGAVMAREFLWRELGLCGDAEKQCLRESVCALVRYHSFPPFAIKASNPEKRILEIASCGELARLFSMRKLCLLERADVLGRACSDAKDYLERIEYCSMLSEEFGVTDKPYTFSSAFTQRAFFLGKTKWRDQDMFDDTWGEVILLSGLPGTGKDTWIEKNCPDLPMISLDEIRRRLHISPTDNQGAVAVAAHEEAKEYLRRKQPFVWNATNITAQMRAKQISLFEQYNASVKTVFLEAEWEEQLSRNEARDDEVPRGVIEKMLSRLEIPERYESETVLWEIS